MSEIQLLYVTNEATRDNGRTRQDLVFFILVDNLAYTKRVEVVWAGQDGVWRTLPAWFHSASGRHKEFWQAKATFTAAPGAKLPGDVQFALRYEVCGKEFWDNCRGRNYCSHFDSGIRLAENHSLLNVAFDPQLDLAQKLAPISVAVDQALRAESVTVHWTTDDWRIAHATSCHLTSGRPPGRAENPNRYGVEVWKGFLNVDQCQRLQYSICCEAGGQALWDNNRGRNYRARRRPLNVLILNLHCYQEENQCHKFSQIALAIDERTVDIVCLQEVAEPWNGGQGDWTSNSANLINQRLRSPYHLSTAWSHLGFDRYREGVAILSRYPMGRRDSRYVSRSEDPYDIHARKVVMAQIAVPSIGPINVFSCHLSWWSNGFKEQFENLRAWADSKHAAYTKGTLLCGDFNVKAGTQGYELVADSSDYEDQFLAATSPRVFEKIFRDRRPQWPRHLADDHRMVYIFMKRTSALRVTSAQVLFTDHDYGRVSDHSGHLMAFEPTGV